MYIYICICTCIYIYIHMYTCVSLSLTPYLFFYTDRSTNKTAANADLTQLLTREFKTLNPKP